MKKIMYGIMAAVIAMACASCTKNEDITPAGTAKTTTIQYTSNEIALMQLNWQMEAELNKSRATVDSLQKVIDDLKSKYETEEEGE